MRPIHRLMGEDFFIEDRMVDMIRVFMVGYSENKGGVEAYIKNLCEHLDRDKYEFIYTRSEMVIDGKKWVRPTNRHNYIKYYTFWKKIFRENHFDVLYFNTCDIVSIDVLRFAKKADIPIRIIHSHSTGNQQGIEQKMNLFHQLSEKLSRKSLHKYATHMFACSQVAGDWMFDGRTYRVIKNGIQLSKYRFNENYRQKLRNLYGYNDEILVGIVGRLSPEKNPFFTVKILETLLKKEGVRAVFVGDGEQRAEVENSVTEAGLSQKVRFVGAVDNVNEWMSTLDCLLMPSLFEGLPFVLVEAQAAGLSCIVSSAVSEEANLTGLVEYVDLKESTEVWADKILAACVNEIPDTTQQLIDAGYSIEDTAKTVSKIIEQSIEKRLANTKGAIQF